MNKYTVRVTAKYTVEVLAESSEEARQEGMDVVSEMALNANNMYAKCLGWEPVQKGDVNE